MLVHKLVLLCQRLSQVLKVIFNKKDINTDRPRDSKKRTYCCMKSKQSDPIGCQKNVCCDERVVTNRTDFTTRNIKNKSFSPPYVFSSLLHLIHPPSENVLNCKEGTFVFFFLQNDLKLSQNTVTYSLIEL